MHFAGTHSLDEVDTSRYYCCILSGYVCAVSALYFCQQITIGSKLLTK